MNHLVAILMTWISINYDLHRVNEAPRVVVVSAEEIAAVRATLMTEHAIQDFTALSDASRNSTSNPDAPTGNEGLMAFYDQPSRTVYLTDQWRADSPAYTSILVHELVHHLQYLNQKQYPCPEAREKLAYQAQHGWLSVFNRTLESEFEIDAFTLLVRTRCMM